MKAVVMAGGEGSRLRPLTSNRPKPMVPICNRPIMEHIVALLAKHGCDEIISTLYYLGDEISSHFADGFDFGVKMHYSAETAPLGTAGSVKKAEAFLCDGTFVIVSGDALTDCDLTKAIEFHRSRSSLATLILHHVRTPLDFGVVVTDETGRITRFVEQPNWSEVISDTVNTGMYILEPEVLSFMDRDQVYDWSGDIFPRLLELNLPMYGYIMDGYWADVGSLSQYREAQRDFLDGKIRLEIDGSEERPGIYIGPNCSIDPAANLIAPVCIGRNCKIKAGAKIGPHTIIGDNSFIEAGALIERSVLWDSVYVGPDVGIHASTVCSRATIKRESVLNEDVVIGERSLIDVGSNIRPRIKIWPDKVVERGSTVTMSLVWGSNWRGSLFRELGVAGLSNIEITPDFACRLGSAYGSCLPAGCRVVTSRDNTRSSRMIKRALIASLLSVGCNVFDMRSAAVPIARHFIKNSGAHGAINVRKLPGNARVTIMELFDAEGVYIPRRLERKVETAFYREDFKRTDSDDLGQIDFVSRAVEEYQADFYRLLPRTSGKRLRVVCDYGYSAYGAIYPAMLDRLGIDSISLNAFSDAKRSPRSQEDIEHHVRDLARIVGTLGYDMGCLITDEGERLTVVTDRGQQLQGNTLLAVLGSLIAQQNSGVKIALPITAPSRLEEALSDYGAQIVRTKADVRALMSATSEDGVMLAGDERGGFIFPELHRGFDAAFSFAKLLSLVQSSHLSLSEVASEVPVFQLAYSTVHVAWNKKGAVMRKLSEANPAEASIEMLDGVKFIFDDSWVLVLPDALEPTFHVYAESPLEASSQNLVNDYAARITAFAAAVEN